MSQPPTGPKCRNSIRKAEEQRREDGGESTLYQRTRGYPEGGESTLYQRTRGWPEGDESEDDECEEDEYNSEASDAHQNKVKPTGSKEGCSIRVRLTIFAGLIMIIIIIITKWLHSNQNITQDKDKDWNSTQKEMNQVVKELQTEFPSLEQNSWTVIKSGMRNLMYKEEPEKPFVLLVLCSEATKSKSVHFAKRLGSSLEYIFTNSSNDPLMITSANVSKFESDPLHQDVKDLKEKIFLHFEQGFKTALVENLLELPPRKIFRLFHTLCDTTEAPFKRVMYVILVMYEPKNVQESKPDKIGQLVLKSAWEGQLSDDNYPSLISRLTESVIEYHHEMH